MLQFYLSAVGSIVSTCDFLHANTLMKLVEMLAIKSQLDSLKDPESNAATDSAYGD